jgi:hypothetical protein
MTPLVTYQGGKQRIAPQIVEAMKVPAHAQFYDLCCGTGAVSMSLVSRGHNPSRITMVDQGPWGIFWEAIGLGKFDMDAFRGITLRLPPEPAKIKSKIEEMYRENPVATDIPYIFLLLQACAIGGCAVSLENGKWKRSSGFRDYWLPTETSSRRSPVNPMMPMPSTIVDRAEEIAFRMKGVTGICGDAALIGPVACGSVAYIDPQYEGTTSYPYSIRAVSVAQKLGCKAWVSEGRALSAEAVQISGGRAKGGVTGDRKRAANEEWLSPFFGTGSPQ